MIEIGPNLMGVLLALVAVLASLVSGAVAVATYKAHGRIVEVQQQNSQRITTVEKVLNGAMSQPSAKESK